MDNTMNHIIELYTTNRYEIISENIIRIDSHEVISKIRNGKRLLTCDCEAQDKSDNSILCRHKLFFIIFPYLERLNSKLWSLKQFYKTKKSIVTDEEQKKLIEIFIEQLDEVKRIK